jgi:SnoaL-like domain
MEKVMSQDQLQQMLDYKEICDLKASFGRLADVKDWEGYRNVFTDDCEFDFGGGVIVMGGQAGTDAIADMLKGSVSVHRAFMPEITFSGPSEAKGIWAVNDYIEWAPDPESGSRAGQMGYGREYEIYRKVDGRWKIAHWRLRYDRLDPLPHAPLPQTFLGGPDVMRDADYVKSVVNPNGT